jgi:hypothetical protein
MPLFHASFESSPRQFQIQTRRLLKLCFATLVPYSLSPLFTTFTALSSHIRHRYIRVSRSWHRLALGEDLDYREQSLIGAMVLPTSDLGPATPDRDERETSGLHASTSFAGSEVYDSLIMKLRRCVVTFWTFMPAALGTSMTCTVGNPSQGARKGRSQAARGAQV